MLIINADDYGINIPTTDGIIACYKEKRITSTSAMVFMEDTERSAALAKENGIMTGLHLNFTSQFTGKVKLPLADYQSKISSYLLKNKISQLMYNPLLKKQFDYVFKAQYDEHVSRYGAPPEHIDGHHHMHLCMNVVVDRLIPRGTAVRRNFSFKAGEKNIANRFYRLMIDKILMQRYVCADSFYDIQPIADRDRLLGIARQAAGTNVELMVHPGVQDEYRFLMSADYLQCIDGAITGTYHDVPYRKR